LKIIQENLTLKVHNFERTDSMANGPRANEHPQGEGVLVRTDSRVNEHTQGERIFLVCTDSRVNEHTQGERIFFLVCTDSRVNEHTQGERDLGQTDSGT
jgi:hypothetical protein